MVSVIVPIFNAEQYLSRCIESILGQKYKDLEIILVDDGSTDTSFQICEKYSNRDERIQVIHQQNKGLVSARKAGINQAQGDYIFYVDADDWIEPDLVEKMLVAYIKSGADILCVNHWIDFDGITRKAGNKVAPGIYTLSELEKNLLVVITPYLWSKFFKRDTLLPYQMAADERVAAGEDVIVTFPLLTSCNKIAVSDICGYHYVQRSNSMLGTIHDDEKELCELVIKFLASHMNLSNLEEQLMDYRKNLYNTRLPFESGLLDGLVKNDRVLIYGAGYFGRAIYNCICKDGLSEISGWFDRDYVCMKNIGFPVQNPDEFDFVGEEYDRLIIALSETCVVEKVEEYLKSKGAKNICKPRKISN